MDEHIEKTILEITVARRPSGFVYNKKAYLRTERQVLWCLIDDALVALGVPISGDDLEKVMERIVDAILEAQGVDPDKDEFVTS